MCSGVWTGPLPLGPFHPNLQALVYDILPRWCSNGTKFVTVNSNYISLTAHVAYPSTNKTKIVCIETELGFPPRADAPRVYVRAWTLCCFHSLIHGPILYMKVRGLFSYPNLSEWADIIGGQLRGDKRVPLQRRNQYSGRVWRKVPEVSK